MIRKLSFYGLVLAFSAGYSQGNPPINVFKAIDSSKIKNNAQQVLYATQYKTVVIDLPSLRNQLKGAANRQDTAIGNNKIIIELPWTDGSMHRYRVLENNTMHPGLAAKFPSIKSYDGYGVDDPKEFVKFEVTPLGFNAMILKPGKSPVFIDPFLKNNSQYYMVYDKAHLINNNDKMRCGVTQTSPIKFMNHPSFGNFTTCFLRKYRLAVAATTSYSDFFGNTIENSLAAQVVAIDRVNGVYEVETAVTFEIIPNNDLLIYPFAGIDPYISGNANQMIDENQVNVNNIIQAPNYDIGHVFDGNSNTSGLAGLGVVCDDANKARGVTGRDEPVGDPYYIDYVAHEIGHQFNATHTSNNALNRDPLTSVEPGSGSTIMGYAGISPPDVQNQSDPYFHGLNLLQIGTFIATDGDCGVKNTIDPAPIVTALDDIAVPASTPFSLVGNATGVLLNQFSYGWEQMDNAISIQPPLDTSPDGPNFRSFTATLNNTRYLPNLQALADNGPFTWEVVPSVSRIMNYRLTVRNNQPGGSCNAYQDMSVIMSSDAGPFVVTYPTTTGIQWDGLTQETVTWDVAGTDIAPINAAEVDVLLSTDGGDSYPYTLALNVPNNGSTIITVPNINTNMGRIMVRSSIETFFNISSNNLDILAPNPTAGSPVFTQVVRNPMNKNNAFIYYSSLGIVQPTDTFTVDGMPNATVVLDKANNRFVIMNINTPRKVEISINVLQLGSFITRSQPITIPGIL